MILVKLWEFVEEIKSRLMDVGIIMIEGELVVRNLYVLWFDIFDVFVFVDLVGVNLRWCNFMFRVIYFVLGSWSFI